MSATVTPKLRGRVPGRVYAMEEWKECSVMDERRRFVAELLDGETMTDVCREFGTSRQTGYKIRTSY